MSVTTYSSPSTCASVDFGELYARLRGKLERIVRADVRAPEVVIEDACQTAWTRLFAHRDGVGREAALSWLATTAIREALKLSRRDGREASLEAALEQPGGGSLYGGRLLYGGSLYGGEAPIEEGVAQRQRLASVAELPERQQRMVWLHALGLSYTEIGELTGDSPRTVERQLLRAKRRLREADSH